MGLQNIVTTTITGTASIVAADMATNPFEVYEKLTGRKLDRQIVDALFFRDKNNNYEITGMAIFCDNVGYSCKVHIHLPGQLNRRNIKRILNYAFNYIKISRLFTELDEMHIMNKVLPRIGFAKIAEIKDVYGCEEGMARNIYVANLDDVSKWM